MPASRQWPSPAPFPLGAVGGEQGRSGGHSRTTILTTEAVNTLPPPVHSTQTQVVADAVARRPSRATVTVTLPSVASRRSTRSTPLRAATVSPTSRPCAAARAVTSAMAWSRPRWTPSAPSPTSASATAATTSSTARTRMVDWPAAPRLRVTRRCRRPSRRRRRRHPRPRGQRPRHRRVPRHRRSAAPAQPPPRGFRRRGS